LVRIDVLNGSRRARHAGVVDEHVDAAELLGRVGDHDLDLLAIAHVADAGLQDFQLVSRRIERRRIDVACVDRVTGREKRLRDLLADAGRSCGDQNLSSRAITSKIIA
jgi:hypothetical protein